MHSSTLKHAKKMMFAAFLLFAVGFQLVHAAYLSGSWTGVWNGQTVNLTTIKPASPIDNLSDLAYAGTLTNFQTTNPSYSCLNGGSINVWTAPNEYPNEYVVHNGNQGTQCAYFTALIPFNATATTSIPAGSAGTTVPTTIPKYARGIAGLSITFILIYAVVAIFTFVLFIWMLIDCIRYQKENKVLWILLILFIGIIGPLIYYFVAKRPRDRQKKMASQNQGAQPPGT